MHEDPTNDGNHDDGESTTTEVKDPKPDRPLYLKSAAYGVACASAAYVVKTLYELFFCVCGGGIF